MSAGRPPRPSRRPDGRSAAGDRAATARIAPAGQEPRPASARWPAIERWQGSVVRRRAAPAVRVVRRPERTLTAAERRAAEVNAKRAPRPPRDPDAERAKIEARSLEQWIDEGALRAEADGRGQRGPRRRPATRPARSKGVRPEAAARDRARRPRRPAGRRAHRAPRPGPGGAASGSASTRPGASPPQLLRELSNVAAVHEVIGLAAYRSGRWKQAAAELELAQQLHPNRRAAARPGRRLPRPATLDRRRAGLGRRAGGLTGARRCWPRPASWPPARRPTRATSRARCAR